MRTVEHVPESIAISALVTTKRNHLNSSQQLLIKQTTALKKAIDFREFKTRMEKVKSIVHADTTKKKRAYLSVLVLYQSVQKDLADLKRQCISSQQLLMYFGNRHQMNQNSLQDRLAHLVDDLEKNINEVHDAFIKRYGPTLFRKHGLLDTENADVLIKELENWYQNGHNSLEDWHRATSNAIIQAQQKRLMSCRQSGDSATPKQGAPIGLRSQNANQRPLALCSKT